MDDMHSKIEIASIDTKFALVSGFFERDVHNFRDEMWLLEFREIAEIHLTNWFYLADIPRAQQSRQQYLDRKLNDFQSRIPQVHSFNIAVSVIQSEN